MSPEWQMVRGLALQWFVGELSEDALEAWRLAFPPSTTPEQVTDAMRGYMADDSVEARQREFMPKPGRLLAYLPKPESAVDAAPWAEVLAALDGARFLGRAGAVDRMRQRVGELGAAFVCAIGVDALKATDLGGEYGQIAQRDLKARWDEFVRSAEADVRRGLPAPQATDSGELVSRDRGLRRLDFGAVAPAQIEQGAA